MDDLARRKAAERAAVFRTAGAEHSLPPTLVEKDFWVCWLLRRLFEPPLAEGMVFKGGTSLSKVWHAISRFSEDIDITIPRDILPGADETEVTPDQSPSQQKKRREKLKSEVHAWCDKEAAAAIRERISSALQTSAGWSLTGTGETIEFAYPEGLAAADRVTTYVQSAVRVEFGAAMPTTPAEDHTVRPYAASAGKYRMPDPDAHVHVLAPERTFWEKATLIHAENNRPEPAPRVRISRHYADLATLAEGELGARAMRGISLLEDVARQKALYYPIGYADYESARNGKLRLVPADDHIPALRHDYEQMREMYFGDPLPFDTIIERLRLLEARVSSNEYFTRRPG